MQFNVDLNVTYTATTPVPNVTHPGQPASATTSSWERLRLTPSEPFKRDSAQKLSAKLLGDLESYQQYPQVAGRYLFIPQYDGERQEGGRQAGREFLMQGSVGGGRSAWRALRCLLLRLITSSPQQLETALQPRCPLLSRPLPAAPPLPALPPLPQARSRATRTAPTSTSGWWCPTAWSPPRGWSATRLGFLTGVVGRLVGVGCRGGEIVRLRGAGGVLCVFGAGG